MFVGGANADDLARDQNEARCDFMVYFGGTIARGEFPRAREKAVSGRKHLYFSLMRRSPRGDLARVSKQASVLLARRSSSNFCGGGIGTSRCSSVGQTLQAASLRRFCALVHREDRLADPQLSQDRQLPARRLPESLEPRSFWRCSALVRWGPGPARRTPSRERDR
jgi:hypothetical protein